MSGQHWFGFGYRPGRGIAVLAMSVTAAFAASQALAAMTINGDARSMHVAIDQLSRGEILAELSRRFALEVAGPVVSSDEIVSGTFRGDLGDIVLGVLSSNNFLIVYDGERPARLLLSERGNGAMPAVAGQSSLVQGGQSGLGGGQAIDPANGMVGPEAYDQGLGEPGIPEPQIDPNSGEIIGEHGIQGDI